MTRDRKCALVVGATTGIGLALAEQLARRGADVILTSRDPDRARDAARDLGARHRGIALDLSRPERIANDLRDLPTIDHLALVGSVRDRNNLQTYDVGSAIEAVTAKLVGYSATISAVLPHMATDGSIVLLGGTARKVPYPGSTSTGLANGGITSMAKTFAPGIAPVRVNAVHPGAVIDSPTLVLAPPQFIEMIRSRTASGRLINMADVVHAILFLFDNPAVNGTNIEIDGGFPTL